MQQLLNWLQKADRNNDLKPQNIVYNEKTNRINFIDFGLMTNFKDLFQYSIQKSTESIQ